MTGTELITPINIEEYDKLHELTVKELTDNMYRVPVSSNVHTLCREALQYKLQDDKYKDFIIAIQSNLDPDYKENPDTVLYDVNCLKGVHSFDKLQYARDEPFISEEESFLENKMYKIEERKELEYNLKYKQLVVALLIQDREENVILLKTHDNDSTRINNKLTFIQGHVDFNSNCYTMSQHQFLHDNMIREFNEEVKTSLNIIIPESPSFIVHDSTSFTGLEHIGFIYVMYVDSIKKLLPELETNEPEKHELVLLSKFAVTQNEDIVNGMDSWTKQIVAKIYGK